MIRIKDAQGDSSTATVKVDVNQTSVTALAILYYNVVQDSSSPPRALWCDTAVVTASKNAFQDTLLYGAATYPQRRDTRFNSLALTLPDQFWDTTATAAHLTVKSAVRVFDANLTISANTGSLWLFQFTASDTLRSEAGKIVYAPGTTINFISSGSFRIGSGSEFVGTPKQIHFLGVYALN
jgi:hypothetical protein